MEGGVVAGAEARAAFHFLQQRPLIIGCDVDARANGIAIDIAAANEPNVDPVVGRACRAGVAIERVAFIPVAQHKIEKAIAIIIGISQAHARLQIDQPIRRRHIGEAAVASILEQKIAIFKHHAFGAGLDIKLDELGGGEEEIKPAVIVVIKKDGAPTDRAAGPHHDAGLLGDIVEAAIALVLQQHHAVHHIREVEIQVEVVVIIADGQAHAMDEGARARFYRDIAPTPQAAAWSLVAPEDISQHVLELVIDDIDIGIAIAVVIGEAGAEAGAQQQVVIQQARDVLKAAVAAVAIERIARFVVLARDVGVAAFGEAGPVDDIEIEKAVAIEIAPGGGGALARVAHASLLGYIGKAASAVVMEKRIGAVVQHIEIQPAIVVVISPDGAAGVDVDQRDLRRQCRDGKAAIAFIAIKHAGIAIASDIEIEPAIAVIIAPGLADAEIAGDEVVVEELPIAAVGGADAGRLADIDEGFELADGGQTNHGDYENGGTGSGLHSASDGTL